MPGSIGHVRDYRELLRAPDPTLPYIFETIFPAGGFRARARAKRRFKFLRRIDEDLREMLLEGERVVFVTQGTVSVSFWEWFFLGWAMYYLNRRAIVLTSQRILLMQITQRGWPREVRSEIDYGGIAELGSTLLGNVRIRFHGAEPLFLTGIRRFDRKQLVALVAKLLAAVVGGRQVGMVRELCPHCFERVASVPPSCPSCGGAFKSPAIAARLSAVFPGAGDFYLGHRAFAFVETSIAALLWLGVVGLAVDPSVGVTAFLITSGIAVGIAHTVDALTTGHIGRKGLYPASGGKIAWRFAAAAVIPVLVTAFAVLQVPGKAQLQPPRMAVTGAELAPRQVDALRVAGLVGPDEEVLYFYSGGQGSVLEEGSLFTADRIVGYAVQNEGLVYADARFDQVVAMPVEYALRSFDRTEVLVILDDGRYFPLSVSPAAKRDSEFVGALLERWRDTRAATEGVWFDGGRGFLSNEPVVIMNLGSEGRPLDAERQWITLMFGVEGVGWKLEERNPIAHEGRSLDEVVVTLQDGEAVSFYFAAGPVDGR